MTFDTETRFLLNISPKQTRLRILLNIPYDQVNDPADLASDATKTYSHDWAQNLTVVDLKTVTQLADVAALIQQAYDCSPTVGE